MERALKIINITNDINEITADFKKLEKGTQESDLQNTGGQRACSFRATRRPSQIC